MRMPTILVLGATLLLTACTGLIRSRPQPKEFLRQDQAGSTNIAVISIDNWDDYFEELQPTFTLNEQKALEAIDQVSRSMESTFIDAIANQFELATPTSGTSSSTNRSTTSTRATEIEDGETTETGSDEQTRSFTETEERQSGDVSEISASTSSVADRAITPSLSQQLPAIGGIDPILKHQAATALLQEVKLLNRYVEKAVQRTGYHPYVVRLQVNVTPSARNEPYDVYTNLSFFGRQFPGATPQSPTTDDQAQQEGYNTYESRARQTLIASIPNFQKEDIKGEIDTFVNEGTPIVIPLLVTDSLESTLHANTTDQIRQLAFSILFLQQGFSGQNKFERFSRNLERTFGRNINSLMTASRLSDNTYRVRLGAMQQVAVPLATIPRNHYVTFLLLAPCSAEEIQVFSTADWVHTKTGISLKPRSPRVLHGHLREIAKAAKKVGLVADEAEATECLEDLWPVVHNNRYDVFRTLFRENPHCFTSFHQRPNFPFEGFWAEIASTFVGSRYTGTYFELPPRPAAAEISNRRSLLLDDKKRSAVVIRGSGLSGEGLRATLKVPKKGSSGNDDFPIPADTASVRKRGTEAVIVFPSLQSIDPNEKTFDLTKKIGLDVTCRGCKRDYCESLAADDISTHIELAYLKKEDKTKPTAGFTIQITAKSIVTNKDGRGSLNVALEIQKDQAKKPLCSLSRLEIRGADVGAISVAPPEARLAKATGFTFDKSAEIELQLKNLTPTQAVAISGQCKEKSGPRKDVKTEKIELPVVVNATKVAPRT